MPNFSTRPLLIAVAAACLAMSAAAQQPAPVPDAKAFAGEVKALAKLGQLNENLLAQLNEELAGLPASLAFVQSELGHPREIVKNAPYTAEAITESIQTLPDGNRIVRKSTTLLARDGAGRTRQERKDGVRAGIYIYDPMDGRSVVLNETSRTAVRIPRMPSLPTPPEPPATPGTTSAPVPGTSDVEIQPGRVVVKRRRAGDAGGGEDVHVEVVRIGRGEHHFASPPSPPLPPLTLPIVPPGKGETKSLGTREFDGIKADGTLTSHTIAAGQIGNERPIVITSERWFSPELHVIVYAKTSDPRAGETIYRLANVKRTEPAADLFKVPADYRTRGEGRRS